MYHIVVSATTKANPSWFLLSKRADLTEDDTLEARPFYFCLTQLAAGFLEMLFFHDPVHLT
jgi:hypothetical protein